jgi:hypothetical protein
VHSAADDGVMRGSGTVGLDGLYLVEGSSGRSNTEVDVTASGTKEREMEQ